MKLKTLLLSSAAAVVVAGGAQAADLSIAEPVEAVQVCDAFGTGYWYIPGTETCIAIHGSVEFDVNFHAVSAIAASDSHSANWNFVTTAKLNVTAKSVTEYGDLVGYIGLRGDYNNGAAGNAGTVRDDDNVRLDNAWLSLGPLLVGHTISAFTVGKDYAGGQFYSLAFTDQVRLTWAMGGFGIMLGIEDPIDRWGSGNSATYTMPDFVAAITASQGGWSGKLAVGVAAPGWGTAYGIAGNLTFALDAIAPGDELFVQGAYGDYNYVVKGPGIPIFGNSPQSSSTNNNWSAGIGFLHNWTSTLSSGFDFSYASMGGGSSSAWAAGANLVWAPVSGFSATLQGGYTQVTGSTGAWTGLVALKRTW